MMMIIIMPVLSSVFTIIIHGNACIHILYRLPHITVLSVMYTGRQKYTSAEIRLGHIARLSETHESQFNVHHFQLAIAWNCSEAPALEKRAGLLAAILLHRTMLDAGIGKTAYYGQKYFPSIFPYGCNLQHRNSCHGTFTLTLGRQLNARKSEHRFAPWSGDLTWLVGYVCSMINVKTITIQASIECACFGNRLWRRSQ